ncbi:MAG TPA: hypothetical protein DCZ95_02530 [Verrucomicrobia bacterium]|nr:hypothetical protein [Verrucomicrobiota bacterium]
MPYVKNDVNSKAQGPVTESKAAFFDHQSGAFFRKIDWAAFWTATILTLVAYMLTLAPSVTLEDSGELAVAPDYLGVPHPPGYPSWTLFTWFFQWIFGWVRYYGQPNPAWGVGLASAVAGAGACGVLALLVSRSGGDMLRGMKKANEMLGYSTESLFCWVGGVTAGLLLAFSPVMWSQSVIVEVYSLNALFQTLVMLFMYRWMSRPREDKSLYILAFLFGLGLTNHQTLMFLGLALAVGVLMKDLKLFRDFAIVGVAFIIMILINSWAKANNHPEMMWIQGPSSKAFWVYTILAVLIPIAGLVLPRGKTVCTTFLLAELGIAFYFFMPFASDQNPPINWGYPRTWEGFMHAITRGQYEKITLTDIFSKKFMLQVGSYLSDLRGQFTLPIVLAGFLPFCAWNLKINQRKISLFIPALILAASATVLIAIQSFLAPEATVIHTLLEYIFRLLILGIMILATIGGVALFVKFVVGLFDRATLESATEDKPLFGLQFDMGPQLQGWIIATMVAFFSLGVILIAFQNPQLDVQTMFIGRVQFIQSHAVYAIWLGYGLVFGLSYLEVLMKGSHFTKVLAVALTAMLPLVEVYQNYFDEEQVKIWGGAEQNGHDFGWQFGRYQLEGWEGIAADMRYKRTDAEFEQLWKDYPTPGYPVPMGSNAIFYGGTDPGRFVPTYMIYSAKVRPDVYLITQNALADNTYMSVMRDLYGDTIWIPSQQDSNYAFQKYVEDVQSGRIPAGADVSFENGRVSVQGVQGVMMINGILAKMIFEANKAKHDFFVEESYVIPWMYPYLEPHGLIMKIKAEQLPALTPQMVENDTKFWDWYAKRLLDNGKFQHDVVARKTFSKLRSAIAGLYAYRRMFTEAEHAFKQAIDLYPLSPEANFRLADILMQQRRFTDARILIEQFLKDDPQNDKVVDFLNQIRNTEGAEVRRVTLEEQFAKGGADINAALELSDLYQKMGMEQQFQGLTQTILNDTNLPPNVYLAVAKIYADGKRLDLLVNALQRFLAREPSNPRVWLDMAAAQAMLNRSNDAIASLKRAIELGGNEVREVARSDQRFAPLRDNPAFRALVPMPQNFNLPMNLPELPGL